MRSSRLRSSLCQRYWVSSWQRTLGQIQNPREITPNSKNDARLFVDIDEGSAAQPLLSANDLARGNSIGLGKVDGCGAWRSKTATVGRGSYPVKDSLGFHKGIADASEVNATVRLGLVGPSRNQIEFASAWATGLLPC